MGNPACDNYRQRYETLFESCPVAVWIEDFSAVARWFDDLRAQGVIDLRGFFSANPAEISAALSRIRVVEVNSEAVRQNGARNKEQLLQHLPELFTEESSEVLAEELIQLYDGARVVDLEIPSRRLDGGKAFMVMRIQVPGPPDNPDWSSVIVTGTDISQRRAMEEQLRLSMQKANAASEAKSRFLAHMSHEIRTPMNGILGMADLLLETPLQPEQVELARTLQSSCRSLLDILNDVLDISRIEANRLKIEHHPVRLREMVADVSDLLARSAHDKNLRFVAIVDHDIPHWIEADETRLRQILFNLAGNAVKFTSQGFVKIHIRTAKNGVFFEVSDSGIGIEQEVLTTLFQPFQQGDSTMTRRFGGTGLGLAIVRGLVRLMNGHIDVSSEPDRGSVFRVCLPLDAMPPADGRQNPAVPDGFAVCLSMKDADQERSVGEFLRAYGIRVQPLSRETSAPGHALLLCDYDQDESSLPPGLRSPRADKKIAVLSPGTVFRNKDLRGAGFCGVLPLPMRQSHLPGLLDKNSGPPPARDATAESSPPLREKGGGFSSLRVLVAEDNPHNQMVIRLSLRRLGVDPVVVEDGVGAVEAVREANLGDCPAHPFDLVILDFQMPRMDGMQAAREILRLPLEEKPFLAALTANAFPEDRTRALAEGFQSYLTKPIMPGQLQALLEKARSF